MKKLLLLAFSLFLFACSMTKNTDVSPAATNELQIQTLKEGTGAVAKEGDNLSVHYTGKFLDGTVFDSSRPRGVPFHFTAGGGQVIEGWDKGVIGMKVGETRQLTIPSSLGYGDNDFGPIPGKSTLVFEVELLEIK